MSQTLTVVIPAYNEERLIGRCLEALASGPERPDEIIVVDNRSTDATASVAAAHPGVRVIVEPRPGVGFARAAGADADTGEIIALIDADTQVSPGWAGEVRRVFSAPGVQAFAGGAAVAELSPAGRFWGRWYYRWFRRWHERSAGFGPMLYGFNSALTAETWRAVRDRLTYADGDVSEDFDLTIVLLKGGFSVARSEAPVVKCHLFRSFAPRKVRGYYQADNRAMAKHGYGNPRRRRKGEQAA